MLEIESRQEKQGPESETWFLEERIIECDGWTCKFGTDSTLESSGRIKIVRREEHRRRVLKREMRRRCGRLTKKAAVKTRKEEERKRFYGIISETRTSSWKRARG